MKDYITMLLIGDTIVVAVIGKAATVSFTEGLQKQNAFSR